MAEKSVSGAGGATLRLLPYVNCCPRCDHSNRAKSVRSRPRVKGFQHRNPVAHEVAGDSVSTEQRHV